MEILNGKVAELGGNRFYMIRIDGVFNTVYARSEYAQDKPYEPLVVVLETDQTFFDMENVSGTVVGLYCPAYMSELNNAGWHLHFISDDRTSGGHVLDLAIEEAVITWDYTDNFEMILPDNDEFTQIDFSIDRSEDVRRAETNE
jgi:acetolactate decarboxylase